MARRPVVVLALAVVAYAVAAWAVAPGFYDGIAPPSKYRWVSPPPAFTSTNEQPLSGHSAIKVSSTGVVNAGSVFTQDAQAYISFTQGTFVTPADRSPVNVFIKPVATFPDPGQVQLATNVYCVTSSSPLAPGKEVLVTLQYATQVPAPSDVYEYQDQGPWKKIGNSGSAAPYYIAARSSALACYAGGYPASAARTVQGAAVGGQTLPIVVALAILVVVLAGIPLAVLRRRGEPGDEE